MNNKKVQYFIQKQNHCFWMILLLSVFLYISCRTTKPSYSLKVILDYPVISTENNFEIITDSQYIYLKDNNILYILPEKNIYSKDYENSKGVITEDSIIKEEIKNKYLVVKMNEKYGYLYDSIKATSRRLVNVDSLLKKKFYVNESRVYRNTDSLVSYAEGENGFFEKKYLRTIKEDDLDPDSIQLFFSREYNKYNLSFSKNLDKNNEAKLYKIKMIYNPNFKSQNIFFQYRREVILKFEPTKITEEMKNGIELNDFFEKS